MTADCHLRSRDRALRAAVATGWLPLADVLVLQLASLATCIDCREAQRPLQVNVAKRTPATLWSDIRGDGDGGPSGSKADDDTVSGGGAGGGDGEGGTSGDSRGRIPRPRIAAVLWTRASPCPALHRGLPPEARRVTFGSNFNQGVTEIDWPRGVEEIAFGSKFSQPVAGAVWPELLQKLSFADASSFNQPLAGVSWPEGLKEVAFGARFNQALSLPSGAAEEGEGVRWPSTLERITLRSYGRDLRDASWPSGLRALVVGGTFDLPIDGIDLPAGLEVLRVSSSAFNHPIDEVAFPATLRVLSFGNGFNQPISGGVVAWPASLEELSLGLAFDQPVEGLRLPAGMTRVSFESGVFNRPVEGAAWPEGLTELFFGDGFNQDVRSLRWPPRLARLVFGDRFNKPVDGLEWPAGGALEEVRFGHNFNQPVASVAWPPSLKRIHFGARFKQCLSGAVWPPALETLDLGDCHMAWGCGPKEGYEGWSPRLEIISRKSVGSLGWQRR